jgi:hypothetical protein
MKLTAREIIYLRWMLLLQYLSTSQVALFFRAIKEQARLKVVRRDLSKLANRGILESFDEPAGGDVGRPEKLYYISKMSYDDIVPLVGLENWQGNKFTAPRSTIFVKHHMDINDFLLKWHLACSATMLQFQFIPEFYFVKNKNKIEKHITITCRHPYNTERRIKITPDWVNTLENPGTGVKTLFIGELDRGSESLGLAGTVKTRTEIQMKIHAYRGFLEEGGFKRFSGEFGYEFKGFRVLFVTSRPDSIHEMCKEIGTGDMVWVTDKNKITAENIFSPIWSVAGYVEKRPIFERSR